MTKLYKVLIGGEHFYSIRAETKKEARLAALKMMEHDGIFKIKKASEPIPSTVAVHTLDDI